MESMPADIQADAAAERSPLGAGELVPYGTEDLAMGWRRALVGRDRDRRMARTVVSIFGLVIGGSLGLFVGGLIGVIAAMLLLPAVPQLAMLIVICTTSCCLSMGAVIGPRVLQREAFDEPC